MSIISFLKNLPIFKFGRSDIIDKIRGAQKKLSEVVLPVLNMVRENNDLRTPQSDYGKQFVANFLAKLPSSMKVRDKNPTFGIIEQALGNIDKLLSKLDDVVKRDLPETIYLDGITYQKANILRLIDVIDFTVDYASKQLAYYVRSEVDVQALGLDAKSIPYTKLEESTILSQQSAYMQAIEMFYAPPEKILSAIDNIPEVLVDIGSVNASVPAANDPLKLGIIPVVSPILRYVGERKVDYDYARYERAKKERKDVELLIEMLTQRSQGKSDARIESILNGYKRELTLIRDKIAKIESAALRG